MRVIERARGFLRRHLELALLGAAAALTTAIFVLTGFLTADFGRAWAVLIGDRDPYGSWAWLTVVLSGLGYLALPLFIAIAVGAGVARLVRKGQVDDSITEDELWTELDTAYEKLKNRRRPSA